MGLDLGKISGVIGLDDSPFQGTLDKTIDSLKKWGASAAKEGEKGGEEGGKRFAEGWGKKSLVLLGAGGLAVAGVFTAALVKGMNLQPVNDKLAASMNLNKEQAAVLSQAAGKVYASNWGESMEDASERTGLVLSSIRDLQDASADEVAKMTGLFSAFSDGFEMDMSRTTQVVGQMLSNGLVANAEEGLDLLTSVLQTIPAASREAVIDSVDEYTPYFKQLGIEAGDMMTVIAMGADNGVIGIDKMADAVKEFGIRSKDGSKATLDAYKELGLNGKKMTDDLAAGGETAAEATKKIAQALLDVDDPAKQSQISIALFGSQMEDLGVEAGTNLLSALSGAEDAFDNTGGRAEAMAKRMGENAKGNIQTFLRTIEMGATEFIGGKFLPALNDVTGKLNQDWGPTLAVVTALLADFGRWVEQNAEWLVPLATNVGIFAAALGAVGLVGFISSLGGVTGALTLLSAKIGLTTIALNIKNGAMLLVAGASKAYAAAQWLVNAALTANPIGLVVVALAALAAGFVFAYQNSAEFRAVVDGALQGVKGIAETVVRWFQTDFLGFWTGAFGAAQKGVTDFAAGTDRAMRDAQRWVGDQMRAAGATIDNFAKGTGAAFDRAARWANDGVQQLGRWVGSGFDAVQRVGLAYMDNLTSGIRRAFDGVTWWFSSWAGAFKKLLSGDFNGFAQDALGIFGRMKDGLIRVFDGIKDGWRRVFDALPEGIKAPLRDAVRWINGTFVGGVNGMLAKISIPFRVPSIPGFASGGYTGAGSKYTPAGIVHAGEVVFSQEDVAAHGGPAAVDRMRRYRPTSGEAFPGAEGYAGGGIVANARQGFNNYNPTYLTALRSWAATTGRTFYMTGNGGARSAADQIRAWNLYQAGLGPLAARPGTSAHERGMAMDIKPWPNPAEVAMLRSFGLGLTVRGEPWHVGWTGGRVAAGTTGSGGGGGGGGGFPTDFGIGALIDGLLSKLPGGSPWKDITGAVLKSIPAGIGKAIMGSFGFEMGTGYASPGIASVAENGAELVLGRSLRNFRGGESVLNAAATSRLLSRGGGGNVFNVTIPVDDVLKLKGLQEFFELLELQSRVSGRA